jgi:RNA polymerase sigma factor (TIGR02999 family)
MSDPHDDSGFRRSSTARLLRAAEAAPPDDPTRADELLPLVYDELRALARARLSHEAPGHTLQPTALVHEAYLRLVGDEDPGWNGRRHFFGAAALAMRRILVERARSRGRKKRGGALERVELRGDQLVDRGADGWPAEEILAVDEAVERLEREDPRKGQIVNLRYFAGLTAEETAAVLGVSLGTVEREWRFIKAWLLERLHAR